MRSGRCSKLEWTYLGGFPAQAVQVRIVWPATHVSWFWLDGVKKFGREVLDRLFKMVDEDMAVVPG